MNKTPSKLASRIIFSTHRLFYQFSPYSFLKMCGRGLKDTKGKRNDSRSYLFKTARGQGAPPWHWLRLALLDLNYLTTATYLRRFEKKLFESSTRMGDPVRKSIKVQVKKAPVQVVQVQVQTSPTEKNCLHLNHAHNL